MKVTLVRVPYSFLGGSQVPKLDFPLGVLYLAGVLEKEGFSVEIVDGLLPETLEWASRRATGLYFNISLGEIVDRVEKTKPDVVGISCLFTVQFPNAIRLARLLRSRFPGMPIVLGGPHATVACRAILSSEDCFDLIVLGEGEKTAVELFGQLRENKSVSDICGIAYKRNGQAVTNSWNAPIMDLDSLPFPAYHLIPMEGYFALILKHSTRTYFYSHRNSRGISVITSRGCPYCCSFCSVHLSMTRKYRAHSAEYVLMHLKHLIEKYHVGCFHFEDDNFTLNLKRFESILDGMIECGWDVHWDTPNGVRVNMFSNDIMRKVKKSGNTHLIIGVESGNQRVLDEVIKKHLRLADVERMAAVARRQKVNLRAFYMIGLPGEKKSEIKNTVQFGLKVARLYDLYGGIAMAVPLIGTEIHQIAMREGYLLENLTEENIVNGFLKKGLIKTNEFDPGFLLAMLQYYERKMKIMKLKKFVWFIVSDYKLLFYFIRKTLGDFKNIRHYVSEIVFWRHNLE